MIIIKNRNFTKIANDVCFHCIGCPFPIYYFTIFRNIEAKLEIPLSENFVTPLMLLNRVSPLGETDMSVEYGIHVGLQVAILI